MLTDDADTRTMAAMPICLPDSVESLSERIRVVVRERQELRAAFAGRDELERNRLELVALQRRLSEALIARFSPAA
jgi:regulator of replication initiation timing